MGRDLFRRCMLLVTAQRRAGVHDLVINDAGILFDGGSNDGVSEGQLWAWTEDADPDQHVRAGDHFGQLQA